MAWSRGEDSEQAKAGALLVADALANLRDLGMVARGLMQQGGGRRRRG